MQTCPKDLEGEKTVLLLAMMLAKKVADHTPCLLLGLWIQGSRAPPCRGEPHPVLTALIGS